MYMVTSGMNPNEDHICHYGVKGMRWGVHRYRNPDGSLTELAKRRMARNEKSKFRANSQNRAINKALDIDNRNHLINAYRSSKAGDKKGEKKYLKNIEANEKIREAIKSGKVKAGRDFIVSREVINNNLESPNTSNSFRKPGYDYVHNVVFNSDKIADKEIYDYFMTPTYHGYITDMAGIDSEYHNAKRYYKK